MPLLRAARAALGLIFREGYRYQRAGGGVAGLEPRGALTEDLFAPVALAGAARRERLSPAYTTRWAELLGVG